MFLFDDSEAEENQMIVSSISSLMLFIHLFVEEYLTTISMQLLLLCFCKKHVEIRQQSGQN